MVERETPNIEEMVEAINDLIDGVKKRWSPDVAGTVLANALGAIVADMSFENKTVREAVEYYHDLVKTGLETLFDVVEKRGVG